MKCDECGTTKEVLTSHVWWTAWGRNSFDFNWEKNQGSLNLCEPCEDVNWHFCEKCGALVDNDYVGGRYISDDPDNDYLCPECAEKADNLSIQPTEESG